MQRKRSHAIVFALVCVLMTACASDDDEIRVISLGSAPSTASRITVAKAGPEGLTPPSSWPKACDLLTEADMRAILPDITQLTRESRRLRFTVHAPDGTPQGERGIPGGHCQYHFYLAGTETEEFKESYKGWLNVTVELAGDPDIVRTNFERMAYGTKTNAFGAQTCVLQSMSEHLCRTNNLAFTVNAVQVPHGFRFEGLPADDENVAAYFNEHALPELVKAVTSKLAGSN